MGLMILKCPKCGQSNLIKENEYYRCPLCESIVFNDDYKTYEETVEKLIHEGKEADMGVLRHSLNIELEQEHLNTENIKSICRQIKAIIPEDVIVSFYLTFVERKSYPKNYESFLKQLSQEKVDKYALDQIVPVIIKSCDIRVKELVEELLRVKELYNEENQRHLRKALQEREDEIERYDTEKDVFICHSSKDIKDIQKLVAYLEDNNISCWYSGRNLPWDIENYWEGIHKAIKDCKVFLFVLSKYSRMSKDVVHELDYARSLNKEIRIEYRIDEVENNLPIKKCFDGIQWIDGSKQCKHEELAERIYNDLESTNKKDVEKKEVQELQKLSHDESIDYNKIEFYLNFEEYNEAIKEIKSLMMQHPSDIKLWELLLEAELEGKQESNTKLIKTFNKLLSLVDIQRKHELENKYLFLAVDINKSKEDLIVKAKEDSNSIYIKGKKYEEVDDFENAAKCYRQAAELGHADAQYRLGCCYYGGEGVKEDLYEAFKWRKLAALQGHADAQYDVGWGYYYGEGVEKDYEESIKWTKLAATQNHIQALIDLGYIYYYGEGVTQDYQEAVKWYKLAAAQGDAESQKMVGSCYYYGYGVTQDYKEAFKWYKKSADQGYAEAQKNLGNCYYYGYGVDSDYQEAVKWFKLAAEQGNKVAQNNLGVCYKNGTGVEKDYKETLKWYRLAADQGYALAQKNLGNCYFYGYGVDIDYQEALKWYRLSAEQGNESAIRILREKYKIEV